MPPTPKAPSREDVSVVVPTLHAAEFLTDCLRSAVANGPGEIIVVDGGSEDESVRIARDAGAQVLHSTGGVAGARARGIKHAAKDWILLLDADVILPPNAVGELLSELKLRDLTGLQTRLHSVADGSGYWGRALATHHNRGKASNDWFSFSAALFDRRTLMHHPFDSQLTSGEDIDLVYRLRRSGARLAVSEVTTALHRYGDSFSFARHQWLSDGRGIGAIIRKYGLRRTWLVCLPLGGAVLGSLTSLARAQPKWLFYYLCFAVYNYIAMLDELFLRPMRAGARA